MLLLNNNDVLLLLKQRNNYHYGSMLISMAHQVHVHTHMHAGAKTQLYAITCMPVQVPKP